MLLQFKAENFKSFLDEMDFSMTPAPKQKDLEYSILEHKIGNKTYKGLCSAIIYGPNASGKTNIISAMDVFKEIVLKGNIRNSDELRSPNISEGKLELIPNNLNRYPKPTKFYIRFVEGELLVEYELKIDLGLFLDRNYQRKIEFESLRINDKTIYERTDRIEFFNLKSIEKYLITEFRENEDSAKAIARNNLNETELFLTNGFKMMFSSKIVSFILEWFEEKFIVIYRADAAEIKSKLDNTEGGKIFINRTTNDAAKLFGINSNALGYVVPEDGREPQLCSIFKDNGVAIPAKHFESYGTVRFINIFPLILKALVEGSVLVMDEFDANIHPMGLMNIINIFHDDINKKNAQLIFNTHNPIFLNANIVRRDEIKFVERDDETHLSAHYSLSDFKTSGSNGVRKADDYLKHYFLGRYGAVKDIDFYDLFETLIKDNSSEDDLHE
ncbi:ATP-binding protein [Holdemanella biformis]|uniref:ATP-binding protein n=2 Tax=Holdemanella biformis TaxID=1735 RepID=A0A413UDI0_9FIRM|nr:ATP-binding protein [Holdemanella biformis]MCC3353875.1 ATP-binding protein [Holdemanella biformis]RHB07201.1 ATP-binding protein [Holdemanella biformis]